LNEIIPNNNNSDEINSFNNIDNFSFNGINSETTTINETETETETEALMQYYDESSFNFKNPNLFQLYQQQQQQQQQQQKKIQNSFDTFMKPSLLDDESNNININNNKNDELEAKKREILKLNVTWWPFTNEPDSAFNSIDSNNSKKEEEEEEEEEEDDQIKTEFQLKKEQEKRIHRLISLNNQQKPSTQSSSSKSNTKKNRFNDNEYKHCATSTPRNLSYSNNPNEITTTTTTTTNDDSNQFDSDFTNSDDQMSNYDLNKR
jgi:hypothetical protein